jgi:hypothetical protein
MMDVTMDVTSASAGASEFVTPAFPHEPAVDSAGVELSNFQSNFPVLARFAGSSISPAENADIQRDWP